MNNNNIYNTNNFVGTIHQDYFKSASNALASNIYATSNTLEQHLTTTSNILENHSSNFTLATSNILQYNSSNFTIATNIYFSNLINNYKDINAFNNADNTHIYANGILGEIRFFTNGAPSYFGIPSYKYITKIQENGQLAVYYPYNPAYPTVLPQWYVVSDTIRDNYAFQTTTSTLLSAIQIEFNLLNGSVEGIETSLLQVNIALLEIANEVKIIENVLGNNYIEYTTFTNEEIQETIQFERN